PPRVFACGEESPLQVPVNTQPLFSAMFGQIWKVGKFEMQVIEVSGGNGIYSGKGAMTVPYLGVQMYCTFDRISVNENMEVIAGKVVSLSKGIDGIKQNMQELEENRKAREAKKKAEEEKKKA